MSLHLTQAELQDLSDVLAPIWFRCNSGMHAGLRILEDRFGVEPSEEMRRVSSSGHNLFLGIMQQANGSAVLLEIVTYILGRGLDPTGGTDHINEIQNILTAHGYTLSFTASGPLVAPISSRAVAPVSQTARTWLDSHMSTTTSDYLSNAASDLSNGNFADCLAKCRNALESLTTGGNFTTSLDELFTNHLIMKGESNRKMDYEIIYDIFGYCSTFGSHSGSSSSASLERASFGLRVTENALWLLLEALEQARSNNIPLNRWR